MDILCTRCGEPWDVYSLVDDMTKEEADKLKAGNGCPCCSSKELCDSELDCHDCPEVRIESPYCNLGLFKPINKEGRLAQSAMAGILGDDIDGLASMMDDFNLI